MTTKPTVDPIETEAIRQIRSHISGIKKRQKLIWGTDTRELAGELKSILKDIKARVRDRKKGITLVLFFYTAEINIFEHCDDSGGWISDLFHEEALKLFLHYAIPFDNKEWLATTLLRHYIDDQEGVSHILVDCAASYLTLYNIRSLVERLWSYAEDTRDESMKRHLLRAVESLARQTNDAPLFEKACRAKDGKLSSDAIIEIGRIYLYTRKPELALTWAQKVPSTDRYIENELDGLLRDIYSFLKDREKANAVALRIFRRHRTGYLWGHLLEFMGETDDDKAIDAEIALILGSPGIEYNDAQFLADLGNVNETTEYLIERRELLDGDQYGPILQLAKTMEVFEEALGASLLYRALLDSILRRGQPKTYVYGGRYLKKLDELALAISDWRGIEPHADYFARIRQQHRFKTSFWSHYKE